MLIYEQKWKIKGVSLLHSFYNWRYIFFSQVFISTKSYFSIEDSGSFACIHCHNWAYWNFWVENKKPNTKGWKRENLYSAIKPQNWLCILSMNTRKASDESLAGCSMGELLIVARICHYTGGEVLCDVSGMMVTDALRAFVKSKSSVMLIVPNLTV